VLDIHQDIDRTLGIIIFKAMRPITESADCESAPPIPSAPVVPKHRPVIGILGGVGPMAGILIHSKIVNKTVVSTDQEHLDVIHLSCPQYVVDRTTFILNHDDPESKESDDINPGRGMAVVARALSKSALAMGRSAVVGVTCNTFHAPLIFDVFMSEVNKMNAALVADKNGGGAQHQIPGFLRVHHMVELTLEYIQSELGLDRVGLMSTSGTRATNLYSDIASKKFKMHVIEVDASLQEELHDGIYSEEDGLKKLSSASQRVRRNFEKYLKMLRAKGAAAVILGCTEIPIVLPEEELFGVKLIDPLDVLANSLIRAVGPKHRELD